MFNRLCRNVSFAVAFSGVVLPIASASPLVPPPPAPGVVTGTNPEPQVILTILLATIPAA